MRPAQFVINVWISFLWLHRSIFSSSENFVLAFKAKRIRTICTATNDCLTSPTFSQVLSVRGGDIVYLESIEDTEKVVADNVDDDNQLVVIYFSSTNCPPCKRVAPLFAELSEEFQDSNIVFCKVNVDENPGTAEKYQVTGWPTFLFLKKGEKIMEIVGGKIAEATLYDWVKLMAPKEDGEEEVNSGKESTKNIDS
ncbi:unnamed protein product [Pseudo-nitzschia multistriata]|uniref:Thioredoxin domain-containing protein n=1 Tax=Pseudo-nitzschia multistriata TaxID=183589 RepID=A0A448YUZ5_9STRA|nr:unnamed protein product [Pseudo-nitzschia multistriata]